MIVPTEAPSIVDSLVEVRFAVAIGVHQTRQFAFLRDINLIADHF